MIVAVASFAGGVVAIIMLTVMRSTWEVAMISLFVGFLIMAACSK